MDRIIATYQNESASMPLLISADMKCNTPEEQIFANVLTNSRRQNGWLAQREPHDRTAIICGSGPSIADCIADLLKIDGDIFALNNAANWLYRTLRAVPAYQVIMDAQPETAALIGPARRHLFASMVDPSLFDQVPTAVLWHASHGEFMVDEIEGFPRKATAEQAFCIGSGATVGNTSLALVYAMGYRKIHIFGMDSCHRGERSHVMHQAINDADPCTLVQFMGKTYVSSWTMKLQADNFVQRAAALCAEGCQIEVHGDGYLQDIWRAARAGLDERTKYEIMWSMPEYRNCGSPGAVSAEEFVRVADPGLGQTVLDLGCGPGRGGQEVKRLAGCNVVYIDFARNCFAPQPFIAADLSCDALPRADFGFCCDVMEHIPPERVDATLANIASAVDFAFFRISLLNDIKGALIGHKLHLSVHPAAWWLEKLRKLGKILHFADYEHCAVYYVDTGRAT